MAVMLLGRRESRGVSNRLLRPTTILMVAERNLPQLFLLLLVTLMACPWLPSCHAAHDHVDVLLGQLDDEDGPLQQVVSVVKGKTDLPCDISAPVEDDQASLVLFYKDDASPSIYTYDARDKFAGRPRHWSDEHVLGKRAFFTTVTQPAGLAIDNVRESDAGLYRCRVDFRRSPTRNSRVNLTVVVPPKQMKITDEKGVEVEDVIGPFDEDSTLILVCVVMGGNPSPEVTWWQEQRMMDRHAESRSPEQGVRNVLQLDRLGRVDLRTSITCQASNTQLTLPLTKSVVIELNLKPLDVRILSSRQPLSSGKRYELTCQTSGSRPSAAVTWWKDGQLLRRAQESVFDGGNITLSQLTVTLSPEDDGKKLVCRAENPHLGAASAVEDSWLLDVYYVPRVRLELGRNLEGDSIREGIDVYFDCHVTARPSAVRLVWRHQGNVLQHNVSAGVIISESSLVLQRVARGATGRYTCHASNAEGEGSSNAFHLNVAHKPVCRSEQKTSYGGAKGLASEVECHVESKPGATSFRWAFNGTGELMEMAMGTYRTTADGSISILRYTPKTDLDFGTLLCWASNPLGTQSQPCVYNFYAAGVPDPPSNCSIANQTASSFEIDCSEGYDGGIPQHFKMHVFDVKTRSLLANLTSSSPRFALHLGGGTGGSASGGNGQADETPRTHSWKSSSNNNNNNPNSLPVSPTTDGEGDGKPTKRHHPQVFGSIAVIPPVGTVLQVTAINAHGTSDPVFIDATTIMGLLPPEMQAGSVAGGPSGSFEFTPTLGIVLAGIVVTGVLMMGAIIAGVRFRWNSKAAAALASSVRAQSGPGGGGGSPGSGSSAFIKQDKDLADYIELGTKDPDVIVQDKGCGGGSSSSSSVPESVAHITSNPLLDYHPVPNGTLGRCGGTSNSSGYPPLSSGSKGDEVVYAELTLQRVNNRPPAHLVTAQHQTTAAPPPSSQDCQVASPAVPSAAVVYAQIDHGAKRKAPVVPNNLSRPLLPDAVRETTLM